MQTLCSIPILFLQSFVCKSLITKPMFVPNAIFNISNINPSLQLYVRSQYDFCSISFINQWLQTLCSFPMRFRRYFACKSMVTHPMFVPNTISAVFQAYVPSHCDYKSYVCSQCDSCRISHVNPWWQTLCSFLIWFVQYFACKAVVTNPMFVPNPISVIFQIYKYIYIYI